MENKQYVVALEISSSKIVGVVGEPNGNGGVDIIDIEAERSTNCVKYGCVQNVEETKSRINRIISRLEDRIAPMKITGVYVAIGGRSMRNYAMPISATFDEECMITENAIEALKTRFYNEADVQGDILDVVPCRYYVDNNEMKNPIGAYGTSVKVQFNGVVARNVLKKNLGRALEHYTIKGYIVTPLALAEHVLTVEERQLGCMLVDFGADTTTITIYREGVLQYLVTMPMGSQLITRDLTTLNVLEDAAEEIKKTSGNAIAADTDHSFLVDGIQLADVQSCVVARSEEIAANINEQITCSGLTHEQIASGIVLVGGGSQLNAFGRLIEQMTRLKVRFGSRPSTVALRERAASGIEYLQVISVVAQAASMMKIGDSCAQMPVVEIEDPVADVQPEVTDTPDDEPETTVEQRHEPANDDEPIKPRKKEHRKKEPEPVPEPDDDDDDEEVHEQRSGKFKNIFTSLRDKLNDILFEDKDDSFDSRN